MTPVEYQKNLDFFREVMQIEINAGVRFFNYDMSDMADDKQKKYFKDRYPQEICSAIAWAFTLSDEEKVNFKRLIQLYTSESFRYFFRRLEEGENNDDGQRMTFKLTMINEETKEETTLIDGTEESQLDNNFQEWILENCSNLKAE